MSKMLVAYRPCGCRTAVLLFPEDEDLYADFYREAEREGWSVEQEDHDSIGAFHCTEHLYLEFDIPDSAQPGGESK